MRHEAQKVHGRANKPKNEVTRRRVSQGETKTK